MRRMPLILMAAITAGAAGSAESQVIGLQAPPSGGPRADDVDVVDRVMSFDRNTDGKVEAGELIDRMQHLVRRGDANGDGALDVLEIRGLARTPPAATTATGRFKNSYQFPEDRWFPSRRHIEGVIDDLRLASGTRERALAVVDAHQAQVKAIEQDASAALLQEMAEILPPHLLSRFKAVVEGPAAKEIAALTSSSEGIRSHVSVFVFPTDLGRTVDSFGLTPTTSREARDAVDRYKAALRDRAPKQRSELVKRMKGVLTDEERENFGAALARRSAVEMGKAEFFVNGPVGGIVRGLPEVPPRPISSPEF